MEMIKGILHKWIFHSKTFWLNFLGFLLDVGAEQKIIALPFIKPSWVPYITAFVCVGNIYLRRGGSAPLYFRNPNGG